MTAAALNLTPDLVRLLRCPRSGSPLRLEQGALVAERGGARYAVTPSGIPLLDEHPVSRDASRQQQHYDRVSAHYVANLSYPHTREYMAYLDRVLLERVETQALGTVAEICCGSGEAFELLGPRVLRGVGVDISVSMLESALRRHRRPGLGFVQGDATRLPLADAAFDSAFMLGGVHHVGDRRALFAEIRRILKPGGLFYFREPVSDLPLWRALRWIVYRVSPALDHETERPLLYRETAPLLDAAGLALRTWHTCGFAGFCLFMNSDVLVVSRLLRFLPGIRAVTRAAAKLDERILRLPGMRHAGLQVVGVAQRTGDPGRALTPSSAPAPRAGG